MGDPRPEDFVRLAPFLARLRAVPPLSESAQGNFARDGEAFLHFHEHEGALFADLHDTPEWRRLPATTEQEQDALLDAVRRACA